MGSLSLWKNLTQEEMSVITHSDNIENSAYHQGRR